MLDLHAIAQMSALRIVDCLVEGTLITIFASVLSEFSLMGALAGLLAATGASLGGAWLAHALELNYRFNATLWIVGVFASVLILGAAGAISTRSMVRVPPRTVLY